MTQHPNQNFEPSTQVPKDPQEKSYRNSGFHFGGLNPTTPTPVPYSTMIL